jgi:hypothetical protein
MMHAVKSELEHGLDFQCTVKLNVSVEECQIIEKHTKSWINLTGNKNTSNDRTIIFKTSQTQQYS